MDYEYTYVFDHFGGYPDDKDERRNMIDLINEMERSLNLEMQALSRNIENCSVVNDYKGTGYIPKVEKAKRLAFHTAVNEEKIRNIVAVVSSKIKS